MLVETCQDNISLFLWLMFLKVIINIVECLYFDIISDEFIFILESNPKIKPIMTLLLVFSFVTNSFTFISDLRQNWF